MDYEAALGDKGDGGEASCTSFLIETPPQGAPCLLLCLQEGPEEAEQGLGRVVSRVSVASVVLALEDNCSLFIHLVVCSFTQQIPTTTPPTTGPVQC